MKKPFQQNYFPTIRKLGMVLKIQNNRKIFVIIFVKIINLINMDTFQRWSKLYTQN